MNKMIIAAILGATTALAVTASASWDVDTIKSVGIANSGMALVFPSDGSWDNNDAPAGPTCSNRTVARIDVTTAGGAEMYRTALSAHLAGRKVRLFYTECFGDTPLANRIDILP